MKKKMLHLLFAFGIFILGGILFLNLSPQFGSGAKAIDSKKIENLTYFQAGKFKNFEKVHLMTETEEKHSFFEFFTNGEEKVPVSPLPVVSLPKDYFTQNLNAKTRVTWFGHSALLVEIEGKKIFLDPMLNDFTGVNSWLGLKRFTRQLPMDAEDLPSLDAVVVSHDHYDHLDYDTILKIKDKVRHFYVPLGVGSHLISWGVDADKITEMRWWEEKALGDVKIIATPSRHFSGRSLFDRNSSLWASFVIQGKKEKIFFSGDSGYSKMFKEIGEKYGPFDLTMLDSGQYDQQWADVHMNPEQSVQAHKDLKGKLFMPIHWGSFKLALHTWYDPVKRATKKAEMEKVKITTPKIGESIILGEKFPDERWWENGD